MRPLTLSEVFGPTFQGEGPSAGRRAAFVRLGLCNLDCRWCDTPYTWDWTGKIGPPQDRALLRQVEVVDVARAVLDMRVPLVVLTGGEPMLQQQQLGELAGLLAAEDVAVEVESNGTLPAKDERLRELATWNVSPKLSGSGVDHDRAINLDVLADYRTLGARYKFVVSSLAELDEVAEVVHAVGVPAERVWIMPEGRSADAVLDGLRRLSEPVLDRGWQLGTRLHVLLWNDERGR